MKMIKYLFDILISLYWKHKIISSPLRKNVKVNCWLIWSTEHGNCPHLLLKVVIEWRVWHSSIKRIVARRKRIHHSKGMIEIWLLSHHIRIWFSSHRILLISSWIGSVSGWWLLLLKIWFDFFLCLMAYDLNWIIIKISTSGFSENNIFFFNSWIFERFR